MVSENGVLDERIWISLALNMISMKLYIFLTRIEKYKQYMDFATQHQKPWCAFTVIASNRGYCFVDLLSTVIVNLCVCLAQRTLKCCHKPAGAGIRAPNKVPLETSPGVIYPIEKPGLAGMVFKDTTSFHLKSIIKFYLYIKTRGVEISTSFYHW